MPPQGSMNYDGQASVTIAPGAATGGTITLPAISGKFHYITRLDFIRSSTAALAGTAFLQVTTTNLPGSLQWQVGNAMVAGGTQIDLSAAYVPPMKSSIAGTATTFVFPSAGAAVQWVCTAHYVIGD